MTLSNLTLPPIKGLTSLPTVRVPPYFPAAQEGSRFNTLVRRRQNPTCFSTNHTSQFPLPTMKSQESSVLVRETGFLRELCRDWASVTVCVPSAAKLPILRALIRPCGSSLWSHPTWVGTLSLSSPYSPVFKVSSTPPLRWRNVPFQELLNWAHSFFFWIPAGIPEETQAAFWL